MKKISSVVMASAIALSMLAFGGRISKGIWIVPPGDDRIQYDEGGTDRSFTTYSQCEATASGLAAECCTAVRFKMISASGGMAGPAVHTG